MSTASARIQAIDALLPQTQCGKCGHPGCKPYAAGIANGEAINKCPPGGSATIHAIAQLLQVPELPLELPEVPPQIALIREAECIGCTKCIQACPVDAIVGAAKLMHTVITAECTGCELCVAPCPVDCIDILPLTGAQAQQQRERADQFRSRHEAHLARLARNDAKRQAERAARAPAAQPATPAQPVASNDDQYKRLKIEAAMAKVVLAKAEKQLAQRGNDELQRQVDELRQAAERAQQALEHATPAAPTAPTEGIAALKQAKIQFALRRAELDKATRQGADDAALQALRTNLEAAAQALHAAEEASGKPLPDLVRTDKRPVDLKLRELKTEHAYARAELQRLERRLTANPEAASADTLQQARQRLANAEQQLHDYQQP
ncbi:MULTISPECIES: RnfABCDGE type electron transport complex subunit B [unclassified Pseudomonas]|uniref:RnfABCDGE type electron transport complex subunit B n=1 Tax=unclassified Pseudomonas TaxID=196821 RepID=UPI00244AD10F|nr:MULTISPECIES: RnfABCDGE type electron transport complex subunit B [unclassified Pseudomonas]MDG9923641.1 RnfABCDGE type electron transport complex subunit B [Pseudomonas sp. GD04045]MDH0036403.1 RnfABCDGE type electron transport complex subunit B [Pseudomonas sp. GD04019]